MESNGWVRSRLAMWARLVAWAGVLGLATGTLVFKMGGRGSGLMIATACAILFWRMVVEMGPLLPQRAERVDSADTAAPESTLVHQL